MRIIIIMAAGICLVFAAMSPIHVGIHSAPVSFEILGATITL